MGQKAAVPARALAHSTWTRLGIKPVFYLTGLQQMQTLLNLLRNTEVLRSGPDGGFRGAAEKTTGAGKLWHKSCFQRAKCGKSLESQLRLRKKVKSIGKDAMQSTLGPRNVAMAKEQEPFSMFNKGINPEPISHTENPYII